LLLLVLVASAARADDIAEVLERSQQRRLAAYLPSAPASTRARAVRRSFDTLVRALGLADPPDLVVIRGDTVAEALQGRLIVANEALADWPETDRQFVLAHELGHIALDHWSQLNVMYRKWVPGQVIQEETDPVAVFLGRDGSHMAYRQEFEADAYAQQAMETLGRPVHDALSVFMRMGAVADTPTHPGTQRRLAALRAHEARAAIVRFRPEPETTPSPP
jgi:hypothetical protein